MKEIKYDNNLKVDINCYKNFIGDKSKDTLKFILLTSITNFLIFSSFLLSQNPFSYSLLGWIVCFGGVEFSIKLLIYKRSIKRDEDIKNRLNDLILELSRYDVDIELEELSKAMILEEDNHREVCVTKEKSCDVFYNEKERREYFCVLDTSKKIRVLKMVRSELLNYERFNYEDYFNSENQQLFLLDEDDINLLDNSIKRVLKRNK